MSLYTYLIIISDRKFEETIKRIAKLILTIQLAGGLLLKMLKIFQSYVKHF